jgi:hypothetical protein
MPISREILNMTLFRQKQSEGNIDVWWLYDDGGEDTNGSCFKFRFIFKDSELKINKLGSVCTEQKFCNFRSVIASKF